MKSNMNNLNAGKQEYYIILILKSVWKNINLS